LTQPFSWELIKRVLRAREHRSEGLAQMLSPVTTVSLEPEPIPMDLKIILVGTRHVYYLLEQMDPEFGLLFQVPADMEEHLDRDTDSTLRFARFVATLVREDGLRPFDRGAVACVVSRAARLAGDSSKLSAQQERITDLLRSADHYAAMAGREVVVADDVVAAIEADLRRRARLRDRALEETLRDHVRIQTEGAAIGQINGLVAISLGRASFGRPVRITVRTWLGRGGVRDIEREVELGGPVHSKGVLILSGFVGARYCHDRPLALGASVVFEQSYGPVEGDSASLAETCALLSALGDFPLRQDIAVTGSIDQHGNVQAVGAVNDKIEGFFDLCQARGLTGKQGVILPWANVDHLMLRASVCRAAAEGRFHVWAVRHVDEALSLLSGVDVGERAADGAWPEGSLNRRVEARLAEYAEKAIRLGRNADGPQG
jgi:lon-related putative ATP-dependent protease